LGIGFRNFTKFFRNISQNFKHFQKMSTIFNNFQNFPKCFERFWNSFKFKNKVRQSLNISI